MSADQQPNTKPPEPYARTMDAARLQKLREGIRRVNFGDGEEPVIAVLGPPDEVDVTAPKRSQSSQDEVRILVYDVKLVGATRGNVRDQTVMLWFDHAGGLTAINSNVDGIESRRR